MMLGNMWIEGHSTFVPQIMDNDYDLNGGDDLYGGVLWRRWRSVEDREAVRVWARGVEYYADQGIGGGEQRWATQMGNPNRWCESG